MIFQRFPEYFLQSISETWRRAPFRLNPGGAYFYSEKLALKQVISYPAEKSKLHADESGKVLNIARDYADSVRRVLRECLLFLRFICQEELQRETATSLLRDSRRTFPGLSGNADSSLETDERRGNRHRACPSQQQRSPRRISFRCSEQWNPRLRTILNCIGAISGNILSVHFFQRDEPYPVVFHLLQVVCESGFREEAEYCITYGDQGL